MPLPRSSRIYTKYSCGEEFDLFVLVGQTRFLAHQERVVNVYGSQLEMNTSDTIVIDKDLYALATVSRMLDYIYNGNYVVLDDQDAAPFPRRKFRPEDLAPEAYKINTPFMSLHDHIELLNIAAHYDIAPLLSLAAQNVKESIHSRPQDRSLEEVLNTLARGESSTVLRQVLAHAVLEELRELRDVLPSLMHDRKEFFKVKREIKVFEGEYQGLRASLPEEEEEEE